MLRRIVLPALAAITTAAISAAPTSAAPLNLPPDRHTPVAETSTASPDNEPPPGTHAGPPYKFKTELMGDGEAVPLKDKAILSRTKLGYRFWSGQQNSHLVVTLTGDGSLQFTDTGTQNFKKLADSCQRVSVNPGVEAVCQVPDDITVSHPLLIEVWPRQGNDYTDTSSLPATFAVAVLSDEGNDVAHLGAGPDFFNGYLGNDKVWGGAGNDWIRGGPGDDVIHAGAGNDDVVTDQGNDTVYGDAGHDRIWTADGNDYIRGGRGPDYDVCGTGLDTAVATSADRVAPQCEVVEPG